MADEVLTFEETRKYLKIKRSLLYKLLQTGEIPASKVGKVWRIRKPRLNQWLDEQEINHRKNDKRKTTRTRTITTKYME